jgi:hypothetical protein
MCGRFYLSIVITVAVALTSTQLSAQEPSKSSGYITESSSDSSYLVPIFAIVILAGAGIAWVILSARSKTSKARDDHGRLGAIPGAPTHAEVTPDYTTQVGVVQAAQISAKVFLCYRRDDSAGYAGRVQDRLEREFGRDLLFMDVDAIPLGVNFSKVLREEVAKCGVLLAVIGPNWLDARGEEGTRRLDDPNDFVRIEIAAALQRDIPVIPILLDGARVPKADQLPKDLEELALRNALNVRHDSFHSDMDKLIRGLKGNQRSLVSQHSPNAL